MSDFLKGTIPSQESLRPNPATNQTGFGYSVISFIRQDRNKNSLKTRLSHGTTYPPHLERVHVHWVDERVAVKPRHCGEHGLSLMKSTKRQLQLPSPRLLLRHTVAAHAQLGRRTASPKVLNDSILINQI